MYDIENAMNSQLDADGEEVRFDEWVWEKIDEYKAEVGERLNGIVDEKYKKVFSIILADAYFGNSESVERLGDMLGLDEIYYYALHDDFKIVKKLLIDQIRSNREDADVYDYEEI